MIGIGGMIVSSKMQADGNIRKEVQYAEPKFIASIFRNAQKAH